MSEVETIEVEKTVKEQWTVAWVAMAAGKTCRVTKGSVFHWEVFFHESELEGVSWANEHPEVLEAARRCILRNREPGEHETFTDEGEEREVVPMRVKDGRLQIKMSDWYWDNVSRDDLEDGGSYDSARRLAYLDKHAEPRIEFRSDAAGERVVALRGDTIIHAMGGPCLELPKPPEDLRRKMQRLWCERKTLGDLEFVRGLPLKDGEWELSISEVAVYDGSAKYSDGHLWRHFNPEVMAETFPHPRGWTRALEIVQRLKREAKRDEWSTKTVEGGVFVYSFDVEVAYLHIEGWWTIRVGNVPPHIRAEAEAKWEEIRPLKDNETRFNETGKIGTMSISGDNVLLITWAADLKPARANVGPWSESDGGTGLLNERLAFYQKNKLADDEGFLASGTRVKLSMSGKWVNIAKPGEGPGWSYTKGSHKEQWTGRCNLTPELYDRCKAFWEANQKKTEVWEGVAPLAHVMSDGKTQQDAPTVFVEVPSSFAGKRVRVECLEDES